MHTCANCQQSFEVNDEDRRFLERVSPEIDGKKYLVPEPVLCFRCRQQSLLVWRNERFMYRRKCDFSGKDVISMYPPDTPFPIYEQEVWWGDQWNALDYGRDFDFSRSFFEQFRELQLQVPRLALVNKQCENSKYTNHSGQDRNCYLSSCVFSCEDIYYSDWAFQCKDCVDCSYTNEDCQMCYEVYYGWRSFRAVFCDFIKSCRNTWFCYDCINCEDCFMSSNLRNKKYVFQNQQLTKEEYEAKMAEMFPMGYSQLRKLREQYLAMRKNQALHNSLYSLQSQNCSGDMIFNCKNCHLSYDLINCEDCRYCIDTLDVKDSLDAYHVGWSELMYYVHAIINAYNCLFCHFTYDCKFTMYSDGTQNCEYVFGCVGLNRNKYCILNKQYTKEEYEDLVPKIIEQMRETGEWGQFLPMEFSPFAYNQTRAMEFFPLTEEEAKAHGMKWSDYVMPVADFDKVIPASELPETNENIPDDVLNWAIECEVTGRRFKIMPRELHLYRELGLPLPRRHPDRRYLDRFATRNLRELYSASCERCPKNVETSYAPGSVDHVLCEECYLKEVY